MRRKSLRNVTNAARVNYAEDSNRPLEILAFLAPLVLFYEAGLLFWLRSDQFVLDNKAHSGMVNFFRLFGVRAENLHVSAMSLPSVALVLTLLIWQIAARLRWKIRWRTIPLMWLESFALAAPLLVVAMVISRAHAVLAATQVGQTSIRSLDVLAKTSMAVGAGIYEELLFRMAVMGGLHMLLFDVAKMKDRHAWVLALLASAIVFTVYHPIRDATGALQWSHVIFLMVAGIWFGIIFQLRGFGIAAGSHCAYDATALLFWG